MSIMDTNCIQNCTDCSVTCYSTALNHCLEAGGKHVAPEHFRLMMECAHICEASARMQMSGSRFCAQICGLCAQVCEACAEDCALIGDMDECVEVCRRCAASCRTIAA
jgi:hypothetical protein